MQFNLAPDIQKQITQIIKVANLVHIKPSQIVCFRSSGSKAKARARIWSLPRIWQIALKVKAHYSIEVISEKYDHLSQNNKIRVLIHELMHIPKTFSGSLLPHRNRGTNINHLTVETIYRKYKRSK